MSTSAFTATRELNCVKALGFLAILVAGILTARADDLPESIQTLRHAGPLDLRVRTSAGREVTLQFDDSFYTTQTLGNRLTTEQLLALDQVREEAPDKFQMLQTLFPTHIAEYLLRSETKLPSKAASSGMVIESSARSAENDFGSPQKTNAFLALQNQYSPYKPIGMSLTGDTLSIGGKIVTERLSAEARAAGRTPEQLAYERYRALDLALARWRAGQLTGNAYAGTIKSFLRDTRLIGFTPEEIRRAYQRVFGRELKTDLEADRVAAQIGHPITYNELQSRR